MATSGAEKLRAGNIPEGIVEMLLGPAGYLASPLSALVPYEQAENPAIPEEARPAARGIMEALGNFVPGPDLPTSAILGGIMSKNRGMLQRLPEFTQDMQKGATTTELYNKHGWFLDKDLQPKYETPDLGVELTNKAADILFDKGKTYSGLLPDFLQGADFFQEFPQLGNIAVHTRPMKEKLDGFYDPQYKNMGINSNMSLEDIRSTLLHETGHAISDIHSKAGWAWGGSPEMVNWQLEKQIEPYLPALQDISHDLVKKLEPYRGNVPVPAGWGSPGERDIIGMDSIQIVQNMLQNFGRTGKLDWLTRIKKHVPHMPKELHPAINDWLTNIERLNLPSAAPLGGKDDNLAFQIYQALLDESNSRTIELRSRPGAWSDLPFYEARDKYVQPHDLLIPEFNPARPLVEQRKSGFVRNQR